MSRNYTDSSPTDSRRLIRPFFLTPDGNHPLPRKRYYDVFSWLITQLAFSFTVSPFILLSFHDSMLVWSRVYFYCIIGVTGTSLFLASPGKKWVQSKVKQHSRPAVARADSHDGSPTLGLPNDPGKAWDDMVEEISAEIESRRRKGQPINDDLKRAAARLGQTIPQAVVDGKAASPRKGN